MPDNVGSEIHEPTSLEGIALTASLNKEHRVQNLYGELTPELLLSAWMRMNKDAASGVDKVTVEEYSQNLMSNIEELAQRVKEKTYKAKLVRRTSSPKDNGKERPLGIPALEDKIVQRAVTMVLNAIYEQEFLDVSYGYRAGKSAKEAVGDLTFQWQYGKFGYLVEADIQGFFDNIDHDWLLKMRALRIDDKAFLNLIRKWVQAGILEPDGHVKFPDTGTPQGGIVSPVLANISLHYALDLWFERVVKRHCTGEAIMCRYADDWVCAFRYKQDAERFFTVLPERVQTFGLKVEPSKTQILRFSRFHPGMERRFSFLGFEFFWVIDRKGMPRVKRRTARKKLQTALKRMKDWIRLNRHKKKRWFFKTLNAKLRGHYQYYGVRGNSRSLWVLYEAVMKMVLKWLNRRSQRKSYTWEAFKRLLSRIRFEKPKITESKRLHRVAC